MITIVDEKFGKVFLFCICLKMNSICSLFLPGNFLKLLLMSRPQVKAHLPVTKIHAIISAPTPPLPKYNPL